MTEATLIEIPMPRLSDQGEEATVIKWLKQPGEPVGRGEPLVEIETDKATMVYEAEFEGVLDEIVVDEGTTAALGADDRARTRDGRSAERAAARAARRAGRDGVSVIRFGAACRDERRQGRQAPRHPRRAPARGRVGRVARRRERHRARRPDRAGGRPRSVAGRRPGRTRSSSRRRSGRSPSA